MTNPKLQNVQVRPPSREQIQRYFHPKTISYWPYILSGAGFLMVCLLGSKGIAFLLISMTILVTGLAIAYHKWKANPSDAEFDRWIGQQATKMERRGMQALDLKSEDLIARPMRIDSYILPGSSTATDYPSEQIRLKQGKDGNWRVSIYFYTYIYPTTNYLAIYMGASNLFSQRLIEQHMTYRYQHILSVELIAKRDTFKWEGRQIRTRIEQLYLKMLNGDTIKLSAIIKGMAQEEADIGPLDALPNPSFEKTLKRLRQFLHARSRLV
jgi:hypothetical protein